MASKTLAFTAASVAAGLSGEETHCIGAKAHAVTYDITGDSLDTLSDAIITMRPAPESTHHCGSDPTKGDKAICVGSNVDGTCSKSASGVPINDVFDCQNCFAAASMDLYYTLNISGFELQGVEVGLRGNHIRGALEVHGRKEGSGRIFKGTVNLIDASKTAKISFTVAKVVPVDITISLPTSMDYSLDWKGELDAAAGVDLDIDLGDHFITWTKDAGFVTHNTTTSVQTNPFVSWNSGKAEADMLLNLQSNLHVDIDNVMWYHFNMNPQLPGQLSLEHKLLKADTLCIKADADFDINHEAEVHFTLFGKNKTIYHMGPHDVYHYHKDQAMHKCATKKGDVIV